ncbi:MAG: cupin domain-containing protein [Acidimicrobiia bacterium]
MAGDDELRPFFFSIADIPAQSIAQMVDDMEMPDEQRQHLFDVFGRDLMTKVILQTPGLSVFHEEAQPGEQVKPHRHGTHQITYVLRGSLHYGNRVTSAGMGYFSPDKPYAWTAGEDGAEWIEIHAGEPQLYAD